MALEVVSGYTGPIDLTLLEDGAPRDVSTAGDVSLRMYDSNEELVAFGGTFAALIAASGIMRFEPIATDLIQTRSPYRVRVRVTDAAGDITYHPRTASDVWTVRPESK